MARAGDALTGWSDLWRTPDQQGQALLDAGEPAQAAARFHDPRRRAYADLEADRYQDAAKLLSPFTDAESEYNRGNALAGSGQLQAALAAYDAALKQAPADKDIRHNRDLVQRALRRQPRSPRPSSRNGTQNGGQSGSSGGQSQPSGAGQQNGPGSQQSGGNPQQSGANSQQSGGLGPQSAGRSPSANSPQAGATNSGSRSDQQARRDAAAAVALARKQQQRGKAANTGPAQSLASSGASRPGSKSATDKPDTGDLLAGGTQTPKQKPETEKQLALDQWLRQIPDSPAGLLQRKFLIEHMMREQERGGQEGNQ